MKLKIPLITTAIITVAIILSISIFYLFIFQKSCETEECFLESLKECSKSTYTSKSELGSWKYEIKNNFGFSENKCKVKVQNLEIKSNIEIAKEIKGKSMVCEIPKEIAGTFIEIQSKLEFCSGPLKEDLQEVLIDRLYNYIVRNIGEITKEIQNQ